MNFLQDLAHPVSEFPSRIMVLKLPDIADPPDMVADSVRLLVAPGYSFLPLISSQSSIASKMEQLLWRLPPML